MAPSVKVRVGQRCALACAGVVHSWANRGEFGSEVVEGSCERCTRLSDGNGDEFHPPLVLLEGRDEGVVLLDLLRVFLDASEVPGELNLYEDESACLFVEVDLAEVGRVRDSFGVYEVRSCVVASLEECLRLFR